MFLLNGVGSAEILYAAAGVGACAIVLNIALFILLRRRAKNRSQTTSSDFNATGPKNSNLDIFVWLVIFIALLSAVHTCVFAAVMFGSATSSTFPSHSHADDPSPIAMQYYCPVFQWSSIFLRTLQFCFIVSALLEVVMCSRKSRKSTPPLREDESAAVAGMTKKFILHHSARSAIPMQHQKVRSSCRRAEVPLKKLLICIATGILTSIAAAFFSLSFPDNRLSFWPPQCTLLVFDGNHSLLSRSLILFLISYGLLLAVGLCSVVAAMRQRICAKQSTTSTLGRDEKFCSTFDGQQNNKQQAGSLPNSTVVSNMMMSGGGDWDQLSNDSKRSRQQLIALGLTSATAVEPQPTMQRSTVQGDERQRDDCPRDRDTHHNTAVGNAFRFHSQQQLCLCVMCMFVVLTIFDFEPYIAAVIGIVLQPSFSDNLVAVLPPALAALSSLLVSLVVFGFHPAFRRRKAISSNISRDSTSLSGGTPSAKSSSIDDKSPVRVETDDVSTAPPHTIVNHAENRSVHHNVDSLPSSNTTDATSSAREQNNSLSNEQLGHVVRRPKRLPNNTNIILPLDTKMSCLDSVGQHQLNFLGNAQATTASSSPNSDKNPPRPYSTNCAQQQHHYQKHNFYHLTGTSFDNSPLFNIDRRRVQLISNLIQAQEPPQLRYAVGKSSSHNAWKRFSMTSFNSLEGLLRSTNSRQSDRSYKSDAISPNSEIYGRTAAAAQTDPVVYSANNYRYLQNYPAHYHQQYKRHSSCFGAVPEEPIFVVAPLNNNTSQIQSQNEHQISPSTTASVDSGLEPTTIDDDTVGGVVLRRGTEVEQHHKQQLKAAVKRRMKKFTNSGAMVGAGVEDPTKSWKYIPHVRQDINMAVVVAREEEEIGDEIHAHRQVNRNTKLNRNSNYDGLCQNAKSQATTRFSYHLPNTAVTPSAAGSAQHDDGSKRPTAGVMPNNNKVARDELSCANDAPVWEEQERVPLSANEENGKKLYFYSSTNGDHEQHKHTEIQSSENQLRQHQINSAQERAQLQQFLYNGQLQNAAATASNNNHIQHVNSQIPSPNRIRTNGSFNWLATSASPYGASHSTRMPGQALLAGLPSRRAASFAAAATRAIPENIDRMVGLNGSRKVCLERSPSSTHI